MCESQMTVSTASLRRYRVYGITLISELRHNLPDEPSAATSGLTIELRAGRSVLFQRLTGKFLSKPHEWILHEILEDGSLYMRWEDSLELLVSSDGKSVLCGNRSNVALEAFDAYLINFAVSAALLQQGEEPLHATVVDIGGRAIGLLGPGGAGKSTLAAHLINRRWDLVTDDMLRLTFDGSIAMAHPGPYRLKLFKDSADRYLRSDCCCGAFNPVRYQAGNPMNAKLIFQPPDLTTVREARRLSALFYLDQSSCDSESNKVLVTPLAGQRLFQTLLSSTMNTRHDSTARLQRQFRFAEQIARTIPVYKLAYPRSYDVLNFVEDQICQAVLSSS
jgi:hypothetical protein